MHPTQQVAGDMGLVPHWLQPACAVTIPSPRAPPLVLPHPLSFPKGGGGGLTLSTSNFHCCLARQCVVRHCHLYPLHFGRTL